MPRIVFDPNITPGELAQTAVALLHRVRDVLGPQLEGVDCEIMISRINRAFGYHDAFRQTLEQIPDDFVAVTTRSVVRKADIEASGKAALAVIKELRRKIRARCPEHYKYEQGLDA